MRTVDRQDQREEECPERPSIILMNGPSSAGKTSLSRALLPILPSPFLHLSSDQLIQAGILPPLDAGASEGEWAWLSFAPRFFAGYHRAIAGFAAAGNSLVVEHIFLYPEWYEDCLGVLSPFDVFFVGVTCALATLEQRELARGDRKIGAARQQLDSGVHERGAYDFVLDTSQGTAEVNARQLARAFQARAGPSSFERARQSRRLPLDGARQRRPAPARPAPPPDSLPSLSIRTTRREIQP